MRILLLRRQTAKSKFPLLVAEICGASDFRQIWKVSVSEERDGAGNDAVDDEDPLPTCEARRAIQRAVYSRHHCTGAHVADLT